MSFATHQSPGYTSSRFHNDFYIRNLESRYNRSSVQSSGLKPNRVSRNLANAIESIILGIIVFPIFVTLGSLALVFLPLIVIVSAITAITTATIICSPIVFFVSALGLVILFE